MAKRAAVLENKAVNPDLTAKALAKTIYEGDYVAFRGIFLPASPARSDSPERFESEKFVHLRPDSDTESNPSFRDILARVKQGDTWAHVQNELQQKRPAQMPSDLLMLLADNAVRLGKYTNAAQAYEVLRIRGRMQEEFIAQANAALDRGNIKQAVKGYIIATGLEYNYSAFPEPLPAVPDYQTRALVLHAIYPERIEFSIGLQPVDLFLRTAFGYMLLSAELAAPLDSRPLETRVAFFKELIEQTDPNWRDFVENCRKAMATMRAFGERLERTRQDNIRASGGLKEEIEKTLGENPARVTHELCGRVLPDGEWWQYLRELAYVHPAAALFVARQVVGEQEILVPRLALDSPAVKAAGLGA